MGGITMVAAAILLLVFAALFFAIGGSIYGGNTNLIISYHQEKVKPEERKAYGKAFGKTILVLASALAISGIILFSAAKIAIISYNNRKNNFFLMINDTDNRCNSRK